ncbi:unnamed protein product [Urochloa decumbens]|uniref:UBC core domain-containing protein n=1 Tax=Urochloa decumbens TaxID=240449 RepID=A0ABC8W114_9POAL
MMYDATGQRIFRHDLVMFEKTTGAEHDRGLVVSLGKTDIIVVLVDGTEVEKKPCDLTVVDRSFLCPGMAVASVSHCSGQPGVITGVDTKLDLVQLDGTDERPRVVATGVSPAEVWPVRELTRGDYVMSGMWLGRVVEVSVDVDVLFNDGTAVCRVTNAGDNKLRVVSKKSYWNRHKDGFYPGDGVAGDASVLKASRWIKGHWKPSHGEGIGGCGGGKWLKRVQKEWKILETSLPDTIYVRGFEDRMDLLRAAMVGASGTPYHDGLFFFDLHLPPSYPAAPPQVKYHSFGLHANPNLYPSGTVCLSLLNTFGGKGTELWSPESSSLVQVVVSIQGLVLTAQPYYNEANYAAQAGTPEGRRNELPYCENTYLVNLHTMLYLIRRPPVGFEMFVRDHFCRRGQHVLRACEAYLHEGCPVGTLDGESIATETSKDRSCSVGFKLALANVVPRLVEAFTEIGARTSNEVDQM